jgi:hypothetical protein
LAACGGPDPNTSGRSPDAEKWLARAKQSYRSGDADDATQAIDGALKAAPKDQEARLVAARIALARLDYAEAVRLTEGLGPPPGPGRAPSGEPANPSISEAKGIRGRALWYSGDIERAADELEDMLRDPSVKDTWARDVAKLARRGHGRHPFAIEGGVVAAVEMPQAGPALVVPLELDGERVLGLIATNFGELMIDATSRKEPAWVNLRFGDRVEVKDVPALTHDLTAVSRTLGAPIKALLGVNVLRHMHVTFDRRGSQFVVRKSDPSPPPEATRMPVFYARGGAMMMRAAVSAKGDGNTLLFIDSSAFYPLALEDRLLKVSGANLSDFRPEPGAPPSWKMGTIPYFKLGSVDLPQIPAMQGANVGEYKETFDVDVGGIAGAALLSVFRVTFGEDGRWLWLELDPAVGNPNAPPPRRPDPASVAPEKPEPSKLEPKKLEPMKPDPGPAKPIGPSAPAPGPAPANKPAPKTEGKGAAK